MSLGGLLLLPLLAACGGGDSPEPVALSLAAPADSAVIHGAAVEVRGRVEPAGARVVVGGRVARVERGEFRARVPLREGSNVIDVGASADEARPTWAAVRITRETLVRLPDLAGRSRDDAVDRLEGLGLLAEIEEGGGLLDRLLPGDWGVCEMQPRAGTELAKGATVRLAVSKTC